MFAKVEPEHSVDSWVPDVFIVISEIVVGWLCVVGGGRGIVGFVNVCRVCIQM